MARGRDGTGEGSMRTAAANPGIDRLVHQAKKNGWTVSYETSGPPRVGIGNSELSICQIRPMFNSQCLSEAAAMKQVDRSTGSARFVAHPNSQLVVYLPAGRNECNANP
jgi:hypothetical protein